MRPLVESTKNNQDQADETFGRMETKTQELHTMIYRLKNDNDTHQNEIASAEAAKKELEL